MRIRHTINGGYAEVSNELGERLIAEGAEWEAAEAQPTGRRGRSPKAIKEPAEE